jgi:hypothetical protein
MENVQQVSDLWMHGGQTECRKINYKGVIQEKDYELED